MVAVAVVLSSAFGISGCTASGNAQSTDTLSPRSIPTSPAPPPATPDAVTVEPLAHVVIIVEENKPTSSIIGNPNAPYFNALARQFASASNYNAITHPSLPNYLALTGGTTAGITDDCNPPGGRCLARTPNVATEIQDSGRTWKMYAEGMPSPCYTRNSGTYAVKHNPFLYYPSFTQDPRSCEVHDVQFTQLNSDLASEETLPDYAFISPNLCHDMHDCSIATGDKWLSREVPAILSSPAFTTNRSLLVITFDEGNSANNTVPLIFAGSAAKHGYQSARRYTHYSLLHTIENQWGLAPLTANDASATLMTDLLQ